jgi:signal transduction histidine kinase
VLGCGVTRVALIGNDQRLSELCCEILKEHSPQHCLIEAGVDGPVPQADIFIWDYQPGLEKAWEMSANQPGSHLVLVDRQDLAESKDAKQPGAILVLKPVTKAALGVWLGQALAEHAGGSVARLKQDRDEILQALIETNLRLQEYDQDRTNFLAQAVHDFRAPLTASNGYCGLLLDEQLGSLSEEQREILRRVQGSLKRLARMADAMFQLSVGMRVQRVPKLEPGDIREPIEQALHEIRPLAKDRRISMNVSLEVPGDTMYFEPEQLEQVALNLLDNACKFTPKTGLIEVTGYPYFWERRSNRIQVEQRSERRGREDTAPNAYRVDVWNTGPSIPDDRLERIFEEYATYGNGGGQYFGGGLGLAICKVIVQRHRGRIWAENRKGGPALSFVVPLRPDLSAGPERQNEAGVYQVKGASL